ncbi:hypothetical protein ASE00_00630 [Sphingomonas sp. Root710]|uniref:DUF2924 domain-containing protein n=1 Tax=Sphingomonas sp. Root710 TaxID=1736594 RepID=UPI0007014673|nr:DUF2924 domain-containing protein [Sphingomonas sp. Root710]KRB85347.1 hypothetical protein ASE00_00630 [Sphingomonas sp. Root710]
MNKLAHTLAALATMSSAQLRQEWQARMKTDCPAFGPELLRHSLGHHAQEQGSRRLVKEADQALRAAAGQGASSLKPGTRLIRSWNSRDISVVVTDGGFEFDGRNWASLSAIAREVTGTSWSGPRFFGLNGDGVDG